VMDALGEVIREYMEGKWERYVEIVEEDEEGDEE
jgi:hypothetical protein